MAAAAVAAADRGRQSRAEVRLVFRFGRPGTAVGPVRSAVLRARRPRERQRRQVRGARAAVRQHAEPDVDGQGRRPVLRDGRARRRPLGRAQADRGPRGHRARHAVRARRVRAVRARRHRHRRRPAFDPDVGEPVVVVVGGRAEGHRRVRKVVRRQAAASRRPDAGRRGRRNGLAVLRTGVLLSRDSRRVLAARRGRHLLSDHRVPPRQRPGPDDDQRFPARRPDERVPQVVVDAVVW